ncbi:LacI family DNA-binding transcriptional regulator [Photobacterium sp. OFAV2-7]|uniref:LacI family DNA-binding transcriptional regulator n=1 Tax=Photobacterium sp. OFAV2-7 TaxID=2917748 RepID=UPI001EF50F5E|nr:substrate-binding domain-containing protein [Photobacterium sp. OFAV2-7]MCG7586574.1 substrate-binding domain-containing protein [Photobacterium sp. OFAV2-7]
MTTLSEISKHLGLSMATVSRALNGYPEVNEKTRKRVIEAAAELGYKPNSVAQKLATGKSKMVGIMLQSPDELVCAPTFLKELSYISNNLGLRGYDLLINSSLQGDNLQALTNFVSKSAIDGMIIKAPLVNDERIKYLAEKGIPFVVHGHDMSDLDYAYYDIDNASISEKAVNLLYQLGHTKIAFLSTDEKLAFAKARNDSFNNKIQQLGLDPQECEIFHCPPSVKDGHELSLEILRDDQRPTAYICSSSKVAYGLYMAANELGVEIGSDISVIAHDDGITHFETREFNPPMTVTCSPLTDSSEPIADAITKLISGVSPSELKTVSPVDLIVRESTGKPKA